MDEKKIHILLCEDSLEGILSGVAFAYKSRYGHRFQKLKIRGEEGTLELFSEYIEVKADREEAFKVYEAVYRELGVDGITYIESAAYSIFEDRAEAIYRFLVVGLANGRKTLDCFAEPAVGRMYEIHRNFANEANHWQEFLRFRVQNRAEVIREIGLDMFPEDPGTHMSAELLSAVIAPRHRVVPRIMLFFADRFHGESFIIYDETHDMAGLHAKEKPWLLYEGFREAYPELFAGLFSEDENEREMQELWKIFFQATDIPERYNPKVQRGLLPLWKRKHMTEFQ